MRTEISVHKSILIKYAVATTKHSLLIIIIILHKRGKILNGAICGHKQWTPADCSQQCPTWVFTSSPFDWKVLLRNDRNSTLIK